MSINMIRPTWVDLRYFGSDRFFPNDAFKAPFSGKMDCEEIVSFDCVLLNMYEIESLDAPLRSDTEHPFWLQGALRCRDIRSVSGKKRC